LKLRAEPLFCQVYYYPNQASSIAISAIERQWLQRTADPEGSCRRHQEPATDSENPFDRLLVSQAMFEGVTVLTLDPVEAQYPGPIEASGVTSGAT
jgi:hypothetical protein